MKTTHQKGIITQTWIIFFILVGSLRLFGQNLVQNGDFEDYYTAPNEPYQAVGWSSAGGTPDYFYTFESGSFGAPINDYGTDAPFSGNGYAGFLDAPYYAARNNTVQFEYLQSQLIEPMVAGRTYQVSVAVAFANKCVIVSDGFGINFSSDTSFDQPDPHLYTQIVLTPSLSNQSGNMLDSSTWTVLNWTYTATGGEQYITIGNFNPNATVESLPTPTGNWVNSGYLYVDDVVVTTVPEPSCAAILLVALLAGICAMAPNIRKSLCLIPR